MRRPINNLLVIFLSFMVCAAGLAQSVPSGISYQAVLRGPGGSELVNQQVSIQFAIRSSSVDGPIVYEENHTLVPTNQYGLFNAVIGSGLYTGVGAYSTLAAIPWHLDPYFLEVRAVIPGSGQPQLVGTSQLLSVPYALFSNSANTVLYETDGDPFNEAITSVSLNANQLVIEEGDATFQVDLSPLSGGNDNDATNELITGISTPSDTQIQIAEGSNTVVGDVSAVAFATWQRSSTSVYNTTHRVGVGTANPTSSLEVIGSFAVAVRVVTAQALPTSDTLKFTDMALLCNVTLGSITLKLPDATQCKGRMYKIRKMFSGPSTANSIFLVPLIGGQFIELSNQYALSHNLPEYLTIISNGTDWYVLEHSKQSP